MAAVGEHARQFRAPAQRAGNVGQVRRVRRNARAPVAAVDLHQRLEADAQPLAAEADRSRGFE